MKEMGTGMRERGGGESPETGEMICRIATRIGSPEIRPSLIEIWHRQPLARSVGCANGEKERADESEESLS